MRRVQKGKNTNQQDTTKLVMHSGAICRNMVTSVTATLGYNMVTALVNVLTGASTC